MRHSNAHISSIQPSPPEHNALSTFNESSASSASSLAYPIQNSPSSHHSYHATSDKENDPGALIITAPVPLSYAARSKSALQAILSLGNDDLHMERGGSKNGASHVETPDDTVIDAEHANVQPRHLFQWQDLRLAQINQAGDPSNLHDQQFRKTQPTMIIRPISASTLMALTEPCLMQWCLDPDNELLSGPASDPVTFPMNSIQRNAVPPPSSTVNSWGY